ncbi:MAG: signal peptidase I [Salinigranum sp.]
MGARDVAVRVVFGALLLVAALLVIGQVIGQPVLLSYVETGSMRPQLQPGDGFVAIPAAVAGPVHVGDVVTYDAVNLNDGNLITHRVVDRTDEGYVTRGDANPVTDQDAGEPPVKRAQIKAKALQVGGRIAVVPRLGVVVIVAREATSAVQQRLAIVFGTRSLLGTQGFSYILFVGGLALYAVSSALERGDGERDRSRRTTRSDGRVSGTRVIVVLTAFLVIALTLSMVVPSGPHEFDVVSSQTDAPGPNVIRRGTSETLAYRVPSNGPIPVVAFLEPEGRGIVPDEREVYVPPNAVRTVPVTLTAPGRTGYYRRYLVEHRYLAVLPRETIRTLYRVHPWLPVVVIDALFAVGFAALGLGLVGDRPIRVRAPEGSGLAALQRWLR